MDAADRVYVVGSRSVKGPVTNFQEALVIRYHPFGAVDWIQTYRGPTSTSDIVRAVAVTDSGEVFATGTSNGNPTGHDFLTLAFDAFGNFLWAMRYDGPSSGHDDAADIAVDGSGRIYVTGTSQGASSGYDIVTLAYDSAGVLLWERRLDGPASLDDGGRALAVTAFGGPVVAAFATESGPGADYLTLAYDTFGSLIWASTYDGPEGLDDRPTGLCVDALGGVVVTGGSGVSTTVGTRYETTTVKYDELGALQWVQRASQRTQDWVSRSVAVDGAGRIFVATAGQDNQQPGGSHTSTTVQLDPAGNVLWERAHAAPWVQGLALAVEPLGSSYVTGVVVDESLPGGDELDWLTLGFDSNGNQLWMATFDSPPDASWEAGSKIAVDSVGRVLVCGSSEPRWIAPVCTTIQYEATCVCSIDVFCTAKVSSAGCTPAISLVHSPSASKGWGSLLRAVSLIPGSFGLFFHSATGPLSAPFHGGVLCAGPPVQRHAPRSTGAGGDPCAGAMSEDLNAYIASGADPALVAGATVYLQAWSRDPGDRTGDSLSDAVSAFICP